MLSDDELMQSIARGESAAFAVLFERHAKVVFGYAHFILGETAKAEDVAQEVWLRVVKLAPSYRGEGHFRAWIKTMTRNLCFIELRNAKRLISMVEEDHDFASTVDLEKELQAAQLKEDLHVALSQLPDLQRVALLLWMGESLTYEEIANQLNLTVSAVKSLLFRAKRNLEHRLLPTGKLHNG
jgi:RNA polymerase sigma-70 factor (ECF subfamily)